MKTVISLTLTYLIFFVETFRSEYRDGQPEIFWNGHRVLNFVGPLKEESVNRITCLLRGSQPSSMDWWLNGHQVANQVQEKGADGEVRLVLTMKASARHNNTSLMCSAEIIHLEGQRIGTFLTASVQLYILNQDNLLRNSFLKNNISFIGGSAEKHFMKDLSNHDITFQEESHPLETSIKLQSIIQKREAPIKISSSNTSEQNSLNEESFAVNLTTSFSSSQDRPTKITLAPIAITTTSFIASSPLLERQKETLNNEKSSLLTNPLISQNGPNPGEMRNASDSPPCAVADADCSEIGSHDYTIILILVGILGGMFVMATIISLVFYIKKKKLMASNRDKPQKGLRQQILAEILEAESPLMLKDQVVSQTEIP